MILHQPDTSDRMAKWELKIFKFDLVFQPRPFIKVQVLVVFLTKYTISKEELEEGNSMLEDP